MALGAVAARMEGDVYQGLFFWREAACLLKPNSPVEKVCFEYDQSSCFDDIVVFYKRPGVNAGGKQVFTDCYQVKYHVDNRKSYSSDAFMDPSFINSSVSLLQKFYASYSKYVSNREGVRLNFVSNWSWNENDPLASSLREDDGQLPNLFFTSSDASEIGKIREDWRAHLGLSPETFHDFARTLRIKTNCFGRSDFLDWVYDRLESAGLRVPSGEKRSSPYDSLYQHFLMDHTNCFDAEILREICAREDLLKEASQDNSLPVIGLRSFVRFAENIEEETDEFICVAQYFNGRCPRDSFSWTNATEEIVEFFNDTTRRSRLRSCDHALLLECLGSFALLAGYEMSRNSGVRIYPIQKPDRCLWRPTLARSSSLGGWEVCQIPRNEDSQDIAIALSVTHDIQGDVEKYLNEDDVPPVHTLLIMRPGGGIGVSSVQGADHALHLAGEFISIIRETNISHGRVHLFSAAPNALLFFIGKFREALGQMVLYEYDFGFERHCTYEPSISLPIRYVS